MSDHAGDMINSSHLMHICSVSDRRAHVYSFNVYPDQLEAAYKLLDKEDRRKSMRYINRPMEAQTLSLF